MKTLIIFILISKVCLGQNKKEKIEVLNKSMDSLSIVLESINELTKIETEERHIDIEGLYKEIRLLKNSQSEMEIQNHKNLQEIEKIKLELTLQSKNYQELKEKVIALERITSEQSFTSINTHDWLMEYQNSGNGFKISLNDPRISDTIEYIGFLKTLNDAVFFVKSKEIQFDSWQVQRVGSDIELKFVSNDYSIIMAYNEDFRQGAYTEGSICLMLDGILQKKTNFVMEGWGF